MGPGRAVSARHARGERPLLMVDVDGVISLFPISPERRPEGSFQHVDGIPHFISAEAGRHLRALATRFELVWATGWEERANEYLPHLLGLPHSLPVISFERAPRPAHAHWKLDAIERHAGARALAWVDDAFNEDCHAWAAARGAHTLLVPTLPHLGLTAPEAQLLMGWARQMAPHERPPHA